MEQCSLLWPGCGHLGRDGVGASSCPSPVEVLLRGWCWGGLTESEGEGRHVGAEVSVSVFYLLPKGAAAGRR